ncbi:MAG: GNAT family N-acetyltransferase [Deltaproteobacteria bacterium]|nr:GNAT family N-acetyltransferase [Deltaproteobacteria bacterium]
MTSRELELGLARRADASAIAAMSRDLIEDGLRWSWTPGRVADSVRRRDVLVVVARDGARLVGFGIMRYGDDDAHLDLLGVAPTHRGSGLGRRLLEWLEKPALVAGIGAVFLEVRAVNRGAQAFYTRLGYRVVARLPGYYQGRETALRMGRELGVRVAAPIELRWPSPARPPGGGRG